MKNKKVMITAFVAMAFASTTFAQDKLKMELGYTISSPVGDFKNYVNKTSVRGATGSIQYSFSKKFALGLQSGYQAYYQKFDRSTYKQNDGSTISAVVSNNVEIVPFIVKGTYLPLGNKANNAQPYLSLGGGVNFVNDVQYLGEFADNETSVPLAVQAGAGVIIPVGQKQTGFKLGATYNYSQYNKHNLRNLNTIGFHAGVVFALK